MIDLSKLPAPTFVEELDYEVILAEMLVDVRSRAAAKGVAFDTISEADPAYIILEAVAYRELLLRQRANEEGKALLIAFAQGTDLDHIGITYYEGEERLVIREADDQANPPIEEILEGDEKYQERLLLKDEGYTTAGSAGAFKFHTRSASGNVKDASVDSPMPGTTVVYVLSYDGDGTANSELLRVVEEKLSSDEMRPLSEEVLVKSATIVPWECHAQIHVFDGPDTSLVLQAAIDSFDEYKNKTHALNAEVNLSALHGALVVPGVKKAVISGMTADLICGIGDAPYCAASSIEIVSTS